jgi:hypothetical protein
MSRTLIQFVKKKNRADRVAKDRELEIEQRVQLAADMLEDNMLAITQIVETFGGEITLTQLRG